jgi:hypothetical protein
MSTHLDLTPAEVALVLDALSALYALDSARNATVQAAAALRLYNRIAAELSSEQAARRQA